jgi:hypothetical protein
MVETGILQLVESISGVSSIEFPLTCDGCSMKKVGGVVGWK